MKRNRDFYNRRVGKDGGPPRLDLSEAASQLAAAYTFFDQQGYLQRSFGYHCVDLGTVAGLEGSDLREALYLNTGIKVTMPVARFLEGAEEVDAFTVVEFVHDHVAKPFDGAGRYHGFSDCGWHYDCHSKLFDEAGARDEWRERANTILKFYEDGYELSTSGEMIRLAPDGMVKLVEAKLISSVGNTDRAKVANAVRTFHLGRSSREQRKQAVRDLVDVLEFHRPAVKSLLSKDEQDLFNVANNFAIRHHRPGQKDDYDEAWLTWLFYVYLSTVHLVLGRIHGHESPGSAPPGLGGPPGPGAADDGIPF